MSSMRKEGRGFMTWSFLKTTRARQEWWDYGDRITHMGLFDFIVPDNTGRITGTIPAADLQRVYRWPHITHLLTVRNDGITSRFRAIVEDKTPRTGLYKTCTASSTSAPLPPELTSTWKQARMTTRMVLWPWQRGFMKRLKHGQAKTTSTGTYLP